MRTELIDSLQSETRRIPSFRTKIRLTILKKSLITIIRRQTLRQKVMILNSVPKAYNIDNILEFLSHENSIFMFYFVGIMSKQIVGQALISIFQDDLRNTVHLLGHWAERNSRGVTQFSGQTMSLSINTPNNDIDVNKSKEYLQRPIDLWD